MKKALWWIVGILLSPILLFLILTILVYLPPVQNWLVDKVASVASEKTGMQISIDHVNLAFPLDLGIDGLQVVQTDSITQHPDTIISGKRMVVDVQMMPLFRQQVVINQLEVNQVSLNTAQWIEAARVKGTLGRLAVASRGIDLDRQDVMLNGLRLEDARLDIALNDSVPEDTTTSENHWKIKADSIVVARSTVGFHMPGDTMSVKARLGHLSIRQADINLETQAYAVRSVDWTDGALQYDQNFQPVADGLDFNHMDLSRISIGIDSIYYHDPTLRLSLRQVAMRDKCGLEITQMTGRVIMANNTVRLPSFLLRTPDSDIDMQLDLPLSVMDTGSREKIRLRLNAQLGKQDLMRFMGMMPQHFQQQWPNYPLAIKGSVNGNMEYMDFTGLDISLPTAFHAKANGFVANINEPKRLRTKVRFQAETGNLGFVAGLLPRDIQRNYRIPRGIRAGGVVEADGPNYAADITAHEGRGTVKVKGALNSSTMRYDAKLNIRQLNIHHFMPHDSIYTLSADARVNGHGTDIFSPRTEAHADVRLQQLGYGRMTLDKTQMTLRLQQGVAHAELNSDNALVAGNVAFDALMSKQRLQATLTTDLHRLDLYRLRMTENPLVVALCGHVDANSDLQTTHYINGIFNDLTIRDSARVYRPRDILVFANMTPDTTLANLQCGDFQLKLNAKGSYEQLMKQCSLIGDSLTMQLQHKEINQPAIRQLLPTMRIHMESQSDNPLANLLRSGQNIDYKQFHFDIETSPEKGINGDGYIHSLVYEGTRLDTINLKLLQHKEQLAFSGQVRNNKRNPQFVFNTLFSGIIQEHGASVGFRYFDADNQLGLRLGAQAEMVDSGISIHLLPHRPTLGYKEFSLNKDNYIFLGANNKVKADINLVADDGTGVKVYSTESDPTALQDITISMNRFNLESITSVMPYAPRMEGLMEGDYHIVQHESGRFSMMGSMAVDGMAYEGCALGNVSTELIYLQKEDDAHAVEARLMKDDEEVGILSGTYYNQGEGSLDAVLDLQRMPLDMVNGFVPDQIAGLEGFAEGRLTIKGALSRPQVNGELMLENSYLVSVPYGMRLRFDDDPVRIVGSNLLFENFTVYAHNDNPLNLMGNVNFADLDHIKVDLRMRADNYQIIDAKETNKSLAYGKAFINFMGRMNGELSNLSMRGKLDVLGTTDMRYILRDSPLSTDNQLDELVKFTDFSDTTQTVVSRPDLTGFNMNLTMNVSKGARIIAYLNADHSNYVDLMGGGTLRMTYNPADNLQLTGKYTLSNGEMKYSLPVIPLKTFTIQDGSYIEFTGDIMNPTLNITATEETKATVTGSNGVGRSVEFTCGVIITHTLSNMGLEFTLDAPEDMQLHSELQAMSIERRGKLAVSMLTTGMYLSEGNTNAFSMNSALSSFLNSEINQITGNALRTLDLSFGLDNSTDASGNTHTDYSFKFAKRFWNNRMKVVVGGKVSSGSDYQNDAASVFDNVMLEYRLDDTANKYVTLFYENNAYDWLDGYTQKYGAGFVWRRTLQTFSDIIRFRSGNSMLPSLQPVLQRDSIGNDSIKVVERK